MTVKVSKPAINLREELADLRKPTGIAGEAMLRAETPQEQFNLIGAGRRNILINGSMAVDQRQTTSTTSNAYGPDRFFSVHATAAASIQQGSTSAGEAARQAGFLKTAKLTCSTASTADGRYVQLEHRIEGYDIYPTGISEGNPVTLSFWVKSSVAGTYYVFLDDANFTPRYTFGYDVPVANTWYYISHTISGSKDLTIAFDNTKQMRMVWVVDYGATYTSADSEQRLNQWLASDESKYCPDNTHGWATSTGSTFEITGVQLELGKVATPFEHRTYGEELALCQRYFFKFGPLSDRRMAYAHNSTDIMTTLDFPVTMRSTPSFSNGSSSSGAWDVNSATYRTINAVVANSISPNSVSIEANITGGTIAEIYALYGLEGDLDAEL